PVCGQPLTIGVEHRVELLADRSEQEAKPPPTAGSVSNLVPLPEILAELAMSGPATRTVERSYDQAIARLGAELAILQALPIEDIAHAGSTLLAEAITRLRAGQVIREAGYDGEYGVIRLFEESELKRLTSGGLLFDAPSAKPKAAPTAVPAPAADDAAEGMPPRLRMGHARERGPLPPPPPQSPGQARGGEGAGRASLERVGSPRHDSSILLELDTDQRAAAEIADGSLMIIAGPGSGKTRTLTQRIAHLIAERGAAAESCLAITFTRRAAAELRARLVRLLPGEAERVAIHTFHSLGLAILRGHPGAAGLDRGFRIASEAERATLVAETRGITLAKAERALRAISKAKRSCGPPPDDMKEILAAYGDALGLRGLVDFDDLIALPVRALAADPALAARLRERWRSVSVDEFQHVDEQQYRLLMLLAPTDLCVIGDPDQAIYGFRGADASCFERFRRDRPEVKIARLTRNYRSSGTIVSAAAQVIAAPAREPLAELAERIAIHAAPTDRAEAESVVKAIEDMIGGHSLFSIDSGRAGAGRSDRSFADFAVLYRTDAQSALIVEALARSGIPYQKRSHAPLADEPAVRALLAELAIPALGAGSAALRAA